MRQTARLDALSPTQLAWLTLLGGFIQGSLFVLTGFHNRVLSISLGAAVFLCGLILMLKAATALRNGIQNERWPREKVENLKAIFGSPWVVGLIIALIALWMLLALSNTNHSARLISWSIYMPIQALTQVSAATRQQTIKVTRRLDWRKMPPIQSSHWGER